MPILIMEPILKGRIEINTERCKECSLCIISCKKTLIEQGKQFNARGYVSAVFSDSKEECNACTLCAVVCPEIAIEVYRG